MAVGYLTSDSLIASIKRRALIPSNQKTFQDADFLALANEEIDLGLVPSILQYHEEYFTFETEVALVADQAAYSIPYRAIGGKFRDVAYKDSSGNLSGMTRIQPEDRVYHQSNSGSNNTPVTFYLRGNEVVLTPTPGTGTTGSLVFLYFLRPNDLVAEDRVAVISEIDTTNGVITVESIPSNLEAGSSIDFIQVKSGHKTYAIDVTIDSVDSNALTFTFDPDDLPSGLSVGDHIAASGECIVPQIPSDLHSVLAQRVAARCLEALGDSQGLTNANTKLQEMETKTGSLIDNRSEGEPQKINNRNSPLSSSRMGRRRRGWF